MLSAIWYLRRRGQKNRVLMESGELDGGKRWPLPRVGLSVKGMGRGEEEWKKGGKWEELK